MRQPQNAKRGRGRGRRGNNSGAHNHAPNRNTSYESNGPEIKLRGNAQQLHEKYMALAHDAATSGERISAEAFTQFADHYFRLHQAAVGVAETKRQQDNAETSATGDEKTDDTKKSHELENTSGADKPREDEGELSTPLASNMSGAGEGVTPKKPKNDEVNRRKSGKVNNADEKKADVTPERTAEPKEESQDGDQSL